jgi:prepilin peptidase CpaA
MNAQVWIAILVGVAAMIDDLSRREISNWIPASALAAGLGWQVGQSGWHGVLYALGGTAAGFGIFLVFYLLGGMGGGDVKLMAGFGALLGAGRLVEAALWTAGVGGLMAAAVLGIRAIRRALGMQRVAGGPETAEAATARESIPYAPAIALGVWLSLVPKG